MFAWLPRRSESGGCGRAQSGWYDRRTRRIRDLSYGDLRVHLEFEVRRVQCRRYGKVKREGLSFRADNPFYTKRFAHYVGRRYRSTTIIGELATVLKPLLAAPTLHPTFVRREDGKPYTVNGIGAMFRRCCAKAGVRDFGLRDLRAKGATDMFRADPDAIRKIQLLLGHRSVRTTEIYLKELLAEIVPPNQQPIVAALGK